MATKYSFSRRYPNTWSVAKIAEFMADCHRVGRIPPWATMKSKKKRGGMIEVTWTWKA